MTTDVDVDWAKGAEMPATGDEVEIRRLDAAGTRSHLDGPAAVLHVRYLAPFSLEQARGVFVSVCEEIERGKRALLAAFARGHVVGTVQVGLAQQPNSPHRAEIQQLLVRRSDRRRGIARRLMAAAEQKALAEDRTLLVLDTVTGDDAERLYERLGWTRVGVIPEYALYPDGRLCDTTVFFKRL